MRLLLKKYKRERANRIKEKSEAAPKEIEFYMPTGSIISAMLLNGIDASTSTSARNEPSAGSFESGERSDFAEPFYQ